MKFFIDFEATRFSNRIINIGCIANNGAQFETLVKPVNKAKVDKFITELTGITGEMLKNAPSADEAFNQLFDFIELNSDGQMPVYYCYGNTDADFLRHTVKYMEDTRACICAQAIQGTMIDYAPTVKNFFVADNEIALRKVYMLVTSQEELIQNHNALEDAMMLKTVVNKLYKVCKPEDKETVLSIPSQRTFPTKAKAPEIFQSWERKNKWCANTLANKDNWVFKCADKDNGNIKYFNNANTAALWVIKYMTTKISPKDKKAVEIIEKNISCAAHKNKCRYNCYWEYKKGE